MIRAFAHAVSYDPTLLCPGYLLVNPLDFERNHLLQEVFHAALCPGQLSPSPQWNRNTVGISLSLCLHTAFMLSLTARPGVPRTHSWVLCRRVALCKDHPPCLLPLTLVSLLASGEGPRVGRCLLLCCVGWEEPDISLTLHNDLDIDKSPISQLIGESI